MDSDRLIVILKKCTSPFPFSRRALEYTTILNRDFTSTLPFPLAVDHGPSLQGAEVRLQLVDI